MTAKKKAKQAAKKPMRKLPPLTKSLDNPKFTLVVEFDTDRDVAGLLDDVADIMELARANGNLITAELTNFPATLDCTKLDHRY